MNDYDEALQGKALVSHIIAGFPDLKTTEEAIISMAGAGVGLVIVEIPFSDPIAGGPEIQSVHASALSSGVTTDLIFDMLEDLRRSSKVPVAIMTYYNPIFVYGREAFLERCVRAGVTSVMVPDLPFEEKGEFDPMCRERGVVMVTMLAPTFPDRMDRLIEDSVGYIYINRFQDAAGFPDGFVSELPDMAARVHAKGLKCIAQSGRGEAGSVLDYVDGAVDGTDIMTLVLRMGRDCVHFIPDYVRGVKTRI